MHRWLTTAVVQIIAPLPPFVPVACKYGDIQVQSAPMFRAEVIPGSVTPLDLPAPSLLPDGGTGVVSIVVPDAFVVSKVVVTLVNFRHPYASDVKARAHGGKRRLTSALRCAHRAL